MMHPDGDNCLVWFETLFAGCRTLQVIEIGEIINGCSNSSKDAQ